MSLQTQSYIKRERVLGELHDFGMGQCVVATLRAPDKATVNEDACLVLQVGPESAILCIADGAGGHVAGHAASELAVESILKELKKTVDDPRNLREPILNAIERCNEALQTQGIGSATTLAVLEVQKNVIRPYHVGDSSIIISGQRGVIKFQTTAHSPVGFGIEAGLLQADAALHHDERHLVSNLVGTSDMSIEMGPSLTLAPFDTVLMCSDGLTDNVAIEDIVNEIRKGPLKECVRRLSERCHRNMGDANGHPDDLSLILYRQTLR